MARIRILDADTTTGGLTLSDNGHTNAKRKETVRWKVKTPLVDSIEAIVLKDRANNVFEKLYKKKNKKWVGEIAKNAPVFTKCPYSIIWKGKDGRSFTFDPIIAIKPTPFPDVLEKIISALFAFVLAIFSLQLFSNRKK